MSASYVVRMPATAVTAAKTLIQITAGAAPLVILDAKVDQLTKTDHEQLNLQVVRKTGAATVTSATPTKLRTLDAASNASAGYNASVEGSDGDVLEDLAWNVISASWGLLSIDDLIVVPPNGVVALKLMTAPAASMSLRAMVKFKELPAEAVWTPLSDANLRWWLKADSLSLTDGDPVTTWADSSGNGYDGTQATGAQKPTYKTSIVGGKPVLRFDGSDDNLSQANAAFPWGSVFTMFIVLQTTDTAFGLYGGQKSGGGGGITIEQAINLAAGEFGVNRTGVDYPWSFTSAFDSSFHLLTIQDTGSAIEMAFDGTAQTLSHTPAAWTPTVDSTIANAIGARYIQGSATDAFFAGDIAEIWLVAASLSAGDQDLHHAYVATKYGLSIA